MTREDGTVGVAQYVITSPWAHWAPESSVIKGKGDEKHGAGGSHSSAAAAFCHCTVPVSLNYSGLWWISQLRSDVQCRSWGESFVFGKARLTVGDGCYRPGVDGHHRDRLVRRGSSALSH